MAPGIPKEAKEKTEIEKFALYQKDNPAESWLWLVSLQDSL